MNSKLLVLTIILIFTALSPSPVLADQDDATGPEPSIAILQSTIQELQATLAKARQDNQSLEDQNQVLNHQFFGVQSRLDDLKKQKARLTKTQKGLQDDMKVSAKEHTLSQQKQKSLATDHQQLVAMGVELKNQIDRSQTRQKDLKKKIAVLQKDVNRLQQEYDSRKVVPPDAKFEAEKDQFLQEIDELKAETRQTQSRSGRFRKQFEQARQRKKAVSSRGDDLKSRADGLQAQLVHWQDVGRQIQDQSKTLNAAQSDAVQGLRRSITDLTTHRAALETALTDLREQRNALKRSLARFPAEYRRMMARLRDEQRWLTKKKDLLADTVELWKDYEGEITGGQTPGQQVQSLRARLASLKKGRESLQSKIGQQEKHQEQVKAQREVLQKDIRQIRRDLARTKAALQRRNGRRDRSGLASNPLLQTRERKIRQTKDTAKTVQARIAEIKRETVPLKKDRQDLRMKWATIQSRWKVVAQKRDELARQNKNDQQNWSQDVRDYHAEVNRLKAQKEALQESLGTIQNQMKATALSSREEFRKEKPQLDRYLKMLHEEHEGLKTKISALTMTMARLREQAVQLAPAASGEGAQAASGNSAARPPAGNSDSSSTAATGGAAGP